MKEIFECKMCGNCCTGEGGIIVTIEEIKRISSYLDVEEREFIEKFLTKTPEEKYSIKIGEKGYCIFFDPHVGCTIHKVKPDICTAWPFFRGNLEDENSFLMAKEYCPGICRDIEFNKFREVGYKFLKENGLVKKDKSAPNALIIQVS